MKSNRWDTVALSFINLILIMALIFGPVYIAISQNNYYFLFMWIFINIVKFNK